MPSRRHAHTESTSRNSGLVNVQLARTSCSLTHLGIEVC